MKMVNVESSINVENALIEIVKNYTDIKAETISRTTHLREDLGLSSFDLIAMSTEIEGSLSINVDNVDILAELDTFGDVVDLVTEKICERN
jgi:acyl carrier protein